MSMDKSYRAFAHLVVIHKLGICLLIIYQLHNFKQPISVGTIQIFPPVNPHSVAFISYSINICRKEGILKHQI